MSEILVLGFVGVGGDGNYIFTGRSVNTDTSVVTSYFVSNRRSKMDIIACCVICKNAARGGEGSCERQNIHWDETSTLFIKFGVAKHFITKNAEGESDSPNYYSTQLEYFGKITKSKMLDRRVNYSDMMHPFIIPKLIDKYNLVAPSPVNASLWGLKENGLNLFEFWTRFKLDKIKLYQVDSYEYSNENEDIVSCEWVMELMSNSFTPELNKCIEDTFYSME